MNLQLMHDRLGNVLLFSRRRVFVFAKERFDFLMVGFQHCEHGISPHGILQL
jgi:hypothetical protein